MTSSNPRALQAFVAKLPNGLRDLCIDFSSCVEGGTIELLRSLENIQLLLLDLQDLLDKKEEDLEVGFSSSNLCFEDMQNRP
jgi:hypothetical protein